MPAKSAVRTQVYLRAFTGFLKVVTNTNVFPPQKSKELLAVLWQTYAIPSDMWRSGKTVTLGTIEK